MMPSLGHQHVAIANIAPWLSLTIVAPQTCLASGHAARAFLLQEIAGRCAGQPHTLSVY